MDKLVRPREVEITPEMIEAGVFALHDFGGAEDVAATDSGLIVRAVFSAMSRAAARAPEQSACKSG